jgi:hypothetical protein
MHEDRRKEEERGKRKVVGQDRKEQGTKGMARREREEEHNRI